MTAGRINTNNNIHSIKFLPSHYSNFNNLKKYFSFYKVSCLFLEGSHGNRPSYDDFERTHSTALWWGGGSPSQKPKFDVGLENFVHAKTSCIGECNSAQLGQTIRVACNGWRRNRGNGSSPTTRPSFFGGSFPKTELIGKIILSENLQQEFASLEYPSKIPNCEELGCYV